MKIVAIMVLAGLVGCSRSDKTATVEQVSTVTVTSADLTVPSANGDQDELDRRVILAAAQNLPVVFDAVGGMNALATHQPTSDDQATFQVQLALIDDADFMRRATSTSASTTESRPSAATRRRPRHEPMPSASPCATRASRRSTTSFA
jgi:hypothetical protein